MSKLVDKERLAKLAKSLDDRAKAAVAAEATRADAAEKAIDAKADQNAAAIAAINNKENGLLAQAKTHVAEREGILQNAINAKVDESTYEAQVTELVNKDDEQAGLINGLDASIKAIEAKMGDENQTLPAVDKKIEDFRTEQQGVDSAQDQKIAALEEALNGNGEDVPGLIADVDAIEKRLDDEGGLVDRIEANEAFVAAQPAKDEALQGEIDAVEGRMDVVEEFVEAHSHEEIEGRLDDLEALFDGEESVDAKINAVHNEVVALESKHDAAVQTQATKDQKQDTAIAAKVAQTDYNEKMGLLDAEDQRLNQAIVDEAARAAAAEKANADAILAINNTDTGILAQAKAYADGKVEDEQERAEGVEQGLDNRLKVVEASVREGGALEGRVAANEAKLAGLEEGCNTVQAAINKAEEDAKAHAEAKIAELVDSAPEAMNTLNELAAAINANQGVYDAYVAEHATAMATMKSDLQAEIDADIAAARTLISDEIDADVKAEADRAKAEEADIRADFAAADAALKTELQAEIDADVKVEKERAEAQEAAIRQELADAIAQEVKDRDAAILVENQRAVQRENQIEEEYKAADSALDERLLNVEAILGGQGEDAVGFDEVVERLEAAEGEIDALQTEDLRLQGEIDKKVAQADYDTKVQALEGADTVLGNRIAVFEAGGGQDVAAKEVRLAAAEGEIDTLQAFMNGHSHKAMEADIAANANAIENEVKEGGARDIAIAAALEDYSTTDEMKALVGNVVNSLALTMENDQVVLKLGGVDGIALTSVHLDMATDDDIDTIIAGLDAE